MRARAKARRGADRATRTQSPCVAGDDARVDARANHEIGERRIEWQGAHEHVKPQIERAEYAFDVLAALRIGDACAAARRTLGSR